MTSKQPHKVVQILMGHPVDGGSWQIILPTAMTLPHLILLETVYERFIILFIDASTSDTIYLNQTSFIIQKRHFITHSSNSMRTKVYSKANQNKNN